MVLPHGADHSPARAPTKENQGTAPYFSKWEPGASMPKINATPPHYWIPGRASMGIGTPPLLPAMAPSSQNVIETTEFSVHSWNGSATGHGSFGENVYWPANYRPWR